MTSIAQTTKTEARINSPLVSIIIPSFNQGQFIRAAIDSCLEQDYRPIEVIVVDGASTDDTVATLHEYDNVPEVKWISEPDDGPADAVNKGLRLARGTIGGIQSSDDAYLPGAVSAAVKEFIHTPECCIIYADCRNVDTEGKELSCFRSAPFTLENFLCKSTLILQPSAFFQIEFAQDLGGWNADYFTCDIELWLRMVFRSPARKVDAIWGQRTMHESQRNVSGAKIIDGYKKMIAESRDLKEGLPALRRAARCGIYLTESVYGDAKWRRWRYFMAILAYPSVLQKYPKLISGVVPGYWLLRHWSRRLRRAPRRLGQIVGIVPKP